MKKTVDIRRLIDRRMKLWKDGKYTELIQEAAGCDKKLPRAVGKMSEESAIKIFTRLILQGKIRQTTRFITEREERGVVLNPYDDSGKPTGKNSPGSFKIFAPRTSRSRQRCFYGL